jgi:hypothetical protein
MKNIHYKIVEVWPNDHMIVVRFWTDDLSEEFLASDSNRKEDGTPVRCRSDVALTLPIPAPKGKELENFIAKQAPLEWFNTLEKIISPDIDTSMDDIMKLKDTTFTADPNKIDSGGSDIVMMTDEEIQRMIDKVTSSNS